MRASTGAGVDPRPAVSAVGLMGMLVALILSFAHPSALALAALLGIIVLLVYSHRWLLAWRQLLGLLILVILFIPIQRYVMVGGLPFQLEPYRILVVLILLGWIGSLLIDRRVTVRRTGFELPIGLIVLGSIASEFANTQRISSLGVQPEVIKGLMFLASFFLIFYFIVSVVRTREDVVRIVEVLCAGGAVLGIFSVIEYRIHYNVFDHLQAFLPFLTPFSPESLAISRGGETRVFASAQHPIALGGLFAMLLPLSIYLATSARRRVWWLVAVLVMIGTISSVSRTSIVMFLGAGLVYVCLRPRQTLKAWPLIVPAVLVIQFAVPGALRTVQASFFPQGGLIAQQSAHADYTDKNRLSRWGPTLDEWSASPLVGQGYATRQPDLHPETFVLDDQWLKTLAETGLIGLLGWAMLFSRTIGRLARRAREDARGGWLEVALAASISSFALGMWFYDAFSFIQMTVVLFILLAITAALVQAPEDDLELSGVSIPEGSELTSGATWSVRHDRWRGRSRWRSGNALEDGNSSRSSR